MSDDMFLTVHVWQEVGTVEDRWGPAGYIVCPACGDYYVCNRDAAWGTMMCKACPDGDYIWVEKESLEAANPHIIEERKRILNKED